MLYISDNAGYFPHNGNLLVDSEVVVGDKHVKCDPYLSNIAALFGGLFRLNTSGYVVMCSYTVSTSIVSFQASAYTQTSWFAGSRGSGRTVGRGSHLRAPQKAVCLSTQSMMVHS